MTELALIGASCEAKGHPTECTEPAPGSVVSTTTSSVTVNGTEVATTATADMDFPSHAHDHSIAEGCHQNESHTLDPSTVSSSITINGSPVYLADTSIATDPTTGGDIDIVDSGGNTSVTETP